MQSTILSAIVQEKIYIGVSKSREGRPGWGDKTWAVNHKRLFQNFFFYFFTSSLCDKFVLYTLYFFLLCFACEYLRILPIYMQFFLILRQNFEIVASLKCRKRFTLYSEIRTRSKIVLLINLKVKILPLT